MAEKQQLTKIGAIWKKKSNDGTKTFYTGTLELDGKKIPIIMFTNADKKTETSPDASIYLNPPREEASQPSEKEAPKAKAAPKTSAKPKAKEVDPLDADGDDVPF